MKKGIIIAIVVLFAGYSFSYSQFSFGVSPGIGLNSAYFGYQIDSKFVPFIGLQYMNASASYEENGQRYDFESEQVVSYTDEGNASVSLFIPNIGLKYFVTEENKIKAYLALSISKPMLSGSMESDGEEVEEFNDAIDNVSLWGGEFGFGVEYFFDENFSVGGEFGIRYISSSYEETDEREIFNGGNEPQSVDIDQSLGFNVTPTFSKISLNYYF